MDDKMKRYAGFLALVLIAVLFLFGTAASADVLVLDKRMNSDFKLVTGSTITITVDCKDLKGSSFENFLVDLDYDHNILGEAKVIQKSVPKGWTLYPGHTGKGRFTFFAADETAENPSGKKFSVAIEFKVTGYAAKDTPFTISVDVSGAADVNGKYIPRMASDSKTMTLKGGIPVGTVITGNDKCEYIVTGKKEVSFYKAAKKATSVTIPATIDKGGIRFKVTGIWDKAFSGNTRVKTVKIGKNVKTIGEQAFASATSLTSVKGNTGLVTIKQGAFKGCRALKSFAFERKLTTLEASAFEGCTSLSSAVLYEKVSFVGAKAFYNCKGLKTLTIRTTKLDDTSTVGKQAFKGTPKKMKVKIYTGDRTLFDEIKETLIDRGVSRRATFKRVR